MTEKVGLEISLDTSKADPLLAEYRKKAEGAAGGIDKLAESEKRLQAMWAGAPNNYAKVTQSFWNMDGAAKSLQKNLAPQAAAISNISAALGENAGAAGKAVAASGQLAAAWAAGGPLGLAVVGLSVGVVALIGHWDDLIKKQDEALGASFAGTDASSAKLRKVQEENLQLQIKISQVGLSEREKGIASTNVQIKGLQAEIDGMRQNGKIWTQNEIDKRNQLEQTIQLLFKQQRLLRMLPEAPSGGGARAAPAAIEPAAIGYGGDSALPESAFAIAGPSAESTQALADARLEVARVEAEQRVRIAREAHDQMLADDKAASDAMIATQREQTATYAAVVGGVATLTGSLAAGIIAGQESAWASFLSGAASQAGQFITLEGAKTLAVGVGGALVGNPAAPAQIAGGIALMAAGSAIATGGAAAAQQLAGGGGRAGGGGGAVSARREVGVNRGRSSGGNGTNNGPTVINVTYSAAGPRPEDTGRAVNTALQAHRRRTGRIG